MKHPEYKHIPMPRLTDDIKDMNGKSGRKLSQCINELSDLLDKHSKDQHEKTDDESRHPRDTVSE